MSDGTRQPAPSWAPGFYPSPFALPRSRILDDDLRERRRVVLGLVGDLHRHPARNLPVDAGDPPVGVRDHRRLAGVGLLADGDIEGQRPQQLDVGVLAHPLPAARAEDALLVPALGTD